MRLISQKTIKQWCTQFPEAKAALEAWALEIKHHQWCNSQELKASYGNASIINQQRVVFNIKANHYRLIVDIDYIGKRIYTVWFGTHPQYDKFKPKQKIEALKYEPSLTHPN